MFKTNQPYILCAAYGWTMFWWMEIFKTFRSKKHARIFCWLCFKKYGGVKFCEKTGRKTNAGVISKRKWLWRDGWNLYERVQGRVSPHRTEIFTEAIDKLSSDLQSARYLISFCLPAERYLRHFHLDFKFPCRILLWNHEWSFSWLVYRGVFDNLSPIDPTAGPSTIEAKCHVNHFNDDSHTFFAGSCSSARKYAIWISRITWTAASGRNGCFPENWQKFCFAKCIWRKWLCKSLGCPKPTSFLCFWVVILSQTIEYVSVSNLEGFLK